MLDGGTPLPDSADVELGGVSLDAVEGALLGAADEGADWLGALDKTALGSDEAAGLTESPELPDCAEGDCWLPLEGTASLEVGLPDSCDTELAAALEPADDALLFVVDDVGEALSTLSPLLWPLTGDVLTLSALALLAPLLEPDEIRLALDDSPEGSDDGVLGDDAGLSPLDALLDGGEADDDDSADGRLEASLGVDDPLG